jgi:type II secretory ATPase GspE/PulE/Tfp pilus assembly ATPase PilB-like protein
MASIEDLLNQGKDKKKKDLGAGQQTAQEKLEEKMKQVRLKEKEVETQVKASQIGFEHIDLQGFPISPEALSLIPRAQAKEEKVIAFLFSGEEVRIGAVDPQKEIIEEIKFQIAERSHANVKVYMISENSFMVAEKLYDALPEVKAVVKGVEIKQEEIERFQKEMEDLTNLDAMVQKVSTTDFVVLVIAAALQSGSSDIHIEAGEKSVVVRLRIDGILQKIASVKKEMWPKIVNRFKLISALKLNITTVPQDGRFTIFVGEGQKVDVRVSTLPTAFGESIVMRLLKPSAISLAFEELGIRGKAYEQLKREVERPNGMIITTGPTGSGKTTTLYAVLKKLNDEETKIITLEDPIEYKLEGISQSGMDKSKDYTFAKGLHSILRQDPDVIMVGELRDLETADVAIQAALTGHLVISTIHTNSAAGAVPRFLSMGVKPFLLAPALNAIIGQRLVRRVCKECKTEDTLDADTLQKVKDVLGKLTPDSGYEIDMENMKFWKGAGCKVCHDTGYKGRMGIYEIFAMTPKIEQIILSGKVSEYQMQEIAIEQGMITMAQDGLLKALDGITSVEEVFSVAE